MESSSAKPHERPTRVAWCGLWLTGHSPTPEKHDPQLEVGTRPYFSSGIRSLPRGLPESSVTICYSARPLKFRFASEVKFHVSSLHLRQFCYVEKHRITFPNSRDNNGQKLIQCWGEKPETTDLWKMTFKKYLLEKIIKAIEGIYCWKPTFRRGVQTTGAPTNLTQPAQ